MQSTILLLITVMCFSRENSKLATTSCYVCLDGEEADV